MAAVLLRLGFQIIILLSCSIYAFARAANITRSPSCPAECSGNNVSIPYPFGIGDGCYISKWFEIVCNETDTFNGKSRIPVIRQFNLEVLEILLDNGQVRVNYPLFTSCTNDPNITFKVELAGSPFVFSSDDNSFVAMGCNNAASIWSNDGKVSIGAVCQSACDHKTISSRNGKSCQDIDCCQTSIPKDIQAFTAKIEPRSNDSGKVVGECRYAFLVERQWFENNFEMPNPNISFPVVLDWVIDSTTKNLLSVDPDSPPSSCALDGYSSFDWSFTYISRCRCNGGFHGNPYVLEGCQDIDECANSTNNYCGDETRCENTLGSYNCIPMDPIPARRSTAKFAIIIIGQWCGKRTIRGALLLQI